MGVSTFYPGRLIDLCNFVEVAHAVNQVETHAFRQQRSAHETMVKYGVQHESWGPFAEGRKDFFSNPALCETGAKYGKSSAQTTLRFLLQTSVVVMAKTVRRERMEENLNVFDFSLSDEDMRSISALDEGGEHIFLPLRCRRGRVLDRAGIIKAEEEAYRYDDCRGKQAVRRQRRHSALL
ncbi:aldo/keto reductase [Lawsonibacter faecis]|uniref:aldo/keto reductase n=1 Tax=Lawsonibacter faecis TaxID=2763052 RepID=UPI00311AB39C